MALFVCTLDWAQVDSFQVFLYRPNSRQFNGRQIACVGAVQEDSQWALKSKRSSDHVTWAHNPFWRRQSQPMFRKTPTPKQSTNLTNPKMHLFHIPQCTIQNRNVHISVLNGAFGDMEQVHCGICELGQSEARIRGNVSWSTDIFLLPPW